MFDWSYFLTTNLNAIPIGLFGAWLGKVWAARIARSEQHDLNKELKSEQHKLDQKLTMYKHELELSRITLQNSSLKRHEIYPNMFSLVQKAYGLISGLTGFQMVSTWNDFERSDFLRFLKEVNATDLIKNEFLARFDDERRSEATDYLQEYLNDKKYSDARNMHIESKNYSILNALYFSQDIVDQLMEIHHSLHCALVDFESVREGHGTEYGKSAREDIKKSQDQIAALEKSMRNELNPS